MKIAVCGIRGVPACYGGFETFAEELGRRLVERGHEVVVYGRKHFIDYSESHYCGVELKLLPAPQHKYLETPVHTLLCLLHLLWQPVDVILVCNAANSPLLFIPRLFGKKIVINVDGIERRRAKWNLLGRLWYRLGEICSVYFAQRLVADADVIKDYYDEHFGTDADVIRYGYRDELPARVKRKVKDAEIRLVDEAEQSLFEEFGVEPGRYLLYVSRLEPENNAHVLIEAYNQLPPSRQKMPLLIVGDAPYAKDYIRSLKELASENIIFAGYRFARSYELLQLGAYLYVQASEVGGTHPALVEAMGFGNAVIANDTPEHREVLLDTGLYYDFNDSESLAENLIALIDDRHLAANLRKKAYHLARGSYHWDKICNQYEELFYQLRPELQREVVTKRRVHQAR